MPVPDYSNFVNAAYGVFAIIMISFAIISISKFKKNCQKLEELKKDEKKKS